MFQTTNQYGIFFEYPTSKGPQSVLSITNVAFQGIQQLFVQVGLRFVAAGHVDDAAGNFHPVLRDTLK